MTLAAGVFASACQAPQYFPAEIKICSSFDESHVALPEGETPVYLHLYDWAEIMEPAPRMGPEDDGGKRYYVQLDVGSHGEAIRKVPAVMYSPERAWLELDGRRIKAIPELWEAQKQRGGGYLRAIRPVPTPVMVNAQPIMGTWLIAFPVPRPKPNGRTYSLNAGPVTINGIEYPTGTFSSCEEPSRWHWQPIVIH